MNLLALAVGIKQKQNVDEIVKKVAKMKLPSFNLLKIISSSLNIFLRLIQFRITDFVVMLFHYDGNVDKWRDLEWSDSAVHVSAINQTKWYKSFTAIFIKFLCISNLISFRCLFFHLGGSRRDSCIPISLQHTTMFSCGTKISVLNIFMLEGEIHINLHVQQLILFFLKI